METKEEKQAHKELENKIKGCKNCCPIDKFECYCDDCLKALVDFANRHGAGVLTRDEHLEELEGEVFGLGNALKDYKEENKKLKHKIKELKQELKLS